MENEKINEVHFREFLVSRFKGRSLKIHIAKIPEEFFQMPFYELERHVNPTDCLVSLKKRFWNLHAQSFLEKKFVISDLHDGICSYQYFYWGVIRSPAKLCWIVRDEVLPQNTFIQVQNQALHRLAEIIQMPLIQNGKIIPKNTNAFLKAFEVAMDLHKIKIKK